MDDKIYRKAQTIKKDMELIDRLYTVVNNSILKFDDKKHEQNNVAIATFALRDLLFAEHKTMFKRDFKDFLESEYEKYRLEFEQL